MEDDTVTRLVRIETKLDVMLASDGDHETRLRLLERWKYGIPASMVMAILPIILFLMGQR